MSDLLGEVDEILTDLGRPKPKVMTVEEAGKILGISRYAAYQAVGRKQIPSIRIGRRILVPVAKFDAMLGLDLNDTPAPPLEAAE
jgi:excisionase family DNA binding protein